MRGGNAGFSGGECRPQNQVRMVVPTRDRAVSPFLNTCRVEGDRPSAVRSRLMTEGGAGGNDRTPACQVRLTGNAEGGDRQ